MITLIPADRQMTTSSSTAAQGGSMIDISPTNRRSSRGIFLIWLKRISCWVFGFWKNKVTESKNSFSNSSKLYISSFKSIFTMICQDNSFHQKEVVVFVILRLMNRHLVLVGWVDRNSQSWFKLCPVAKDLNFSNDCQPGAFLSKEEPDWSSEVQAQQSCYQLYISNCHHVLCKCSSLNWVDGWSLTKCFYSFRQ